MAISSDDGSDDLAYRASVRRSAIRDTARWLSRPTIGSDGWPATGVPVTLPERGEPPGLQSGDMTLTQGGVMSVVPQHPCGYLPALLFRIRVAA
jgi:hypothetical protein